MRSRYRTVLVVLAAVFAVSVVGAASASAALPEFVPGAGEKLPIALEGSFPTAKAISLETEIEAWGGICEGVKSSGSITGAKTLSLSLTLQNCKVDSGEGCETEGSEEGLETLSGSASLVYVDKATKQVAALLTPSASVVRCAGEKLKVKGSLLIPLTPVNTKTSKPGFILKKSGLAHNEITSYENEKGEIKKAFLEVNYGAGYFQCSLELNGGKELQLTASKAFTLDA
jgi:hypothetical protein